MPSDRVADGLRASLAAAESERHPGGTRRMLMQIAMRFQRHPKSPAQLHAAVELYHKVLSLCPQDERLLRARIKAREGTAL